MDEFRLGAAAGQPVAAAPAPFDRTAARHVDQYVANGQVTGRESGASGAGMRPWYAPSRGRALCGLGTRRLRAVRRQLVRHGRPELAIEAAAAAGMLIKVAGAGPELRRLKARYAGQVEFLGRVPDEELPGLYAKATALLVPSVEEFGMAAVEAQAAGRPVVAVDAGGARETVLHGRTGWLVPNEDVASMARALRQDLSRFDPEDIRAHAQSFSHSVFEAQLREIVEAG